MLEGKIINILFFVLLINDDPNQEYITFPAKIVKHNSKRSLYEHLTILQV